MTDVLKLTGDDIAEIRQTLALFAHVFDNGDSEGLHLVFTPSATVQSGLKDGYVLRGIDALREFTATFTVRSLDHHTLDTVIMLGNDGIVRARSRYLAILANGEMHNGDFFDVLERTGEGWRIGYRVSIPRIPSLGEQGLSAAFLDLWRPIRQNRLFRSENT
jgi:hypothetical protein